MWIPFICFLSNYYVPEMILMLKMIIEPIVNLIVFKLILLINKSYLTLL